jgi:hypothetical protein
VPRILTDDQKQRRLHISADLLHNAEVFDRVITGDETWCFQYDPEIKRQSIQWKTQNSSRPKKHACLARSSRPCFVFLRSQGTVHYEFIAQGPTVNQQWYLEVLTRLRESVLRKRPELWPDKWILHHDNELLLLLLILLLLLLLLLPPLLLLLLHRVTHPAGNITE